MALNNHGMCLAESDRLEQAEHTCSHAVVLLGELAETDSRLTQDYIQCLVNLGHISIRSKSFRAATATLRLALAKAGELPEFDDTGITSLLRTAEQRESQR